MHDTIRMQAVKAVNGAILLVEDEELLGRGLSRMIESLGYKVTHVLTGEEAIALVTTKSFDVVMTDLHLDGSSGMDVLAVTRAYLPDASLVVMTAAPSMETAIAAVNMGVVEYLLKPFERDQVKRTLERATYKRISATMPSPAMLPQINEVDGALRERFDMALATLTVELEPICDAANRELVGFTSRMRSSEETLSTENDLVVAAAELNRLPELRRRARDLSVKAFASAPASALLFVDIQTRDLTDEDLFSTEPPIARIAERVVLQLRGGFADKSMEELVSRLSVLRFIGYRIALADLDGTQAAIHALAEIAPEYARIDAKVVKGIAGSPANRRIIAAISSMCAALGVMSIADGVGCAEDRLTLVEAGCRLVQGSLVARHAPVATKPLSDIAAATPMRPSYVRQA